MYIMYTNFGKFITRVLSKCLGPVLSLEVKVVCCTFIQIYKILNQEKNDKL